MQKSQVQMMVLLGWVLAACEVQPRPVPGRSVQSPEIQRTEVRESSGAEKKAPHSFETAGVVWTIRAAKPRRGPHPSSAWELDEFLPVHPLIDGGIAALTDPLAWPDDPDSILMVQIHSLRGADWSARCIRPDESAEESLPSRRIEWDSESESGVIPLSEIFGQRGERRDPATVCHLDVRFDLAGAPRSYQLSLRVLAGLPAPVPLERRDHEWATGAVIREETWRNEGFRNLKLELAAESQLVMSTQVEERGFVDIRGRPRQLGNILQTYHSSVYQVAVEARLEVDGRWSGWARLPLSVRWPSGSIIRVEYRLAAAEGARVCSLADRDVRALPLMNVKVGVQFRKTHQQFRGGLTWTVGVVEGAKVQGAGEPRQSRHRELQEAEGVPPVLEGIPFDCQGWVS